MHSSIFQNNSNGQGILGNSEKGIQEVSGLIGCATVMIRNDIANLKNKMDASGRNRRRRKIQEVLGTTADGEMIVLARFDDGSQDITARLTNVKGPCAAYQLKFEEEDWDPLLFALHFNGSGDWIAGYKEKVNRPSYLYDLLLRLGVRFEGRISQNNAKQVLYEAFIGPISMTKNTVTTSALAGWHDKTFSHEDKSPIRVQECIAKFPVLHKKFAVLEFIEDTAQEYFREMSRIQDTKDRLLMMVYPFLGMTASIFDECTYPLRFGLNVIALSGLNVEQLCDWMQVFNRQFCSPISSDISDKKLREEIRSVRDEVIIIDCRENADDTYYERGKKQKRCQGIFRKVLDERKVQGRRVPICAGVCTISSKVQTGKTVYNIFGMDETNEVKENDFRKSKVMDRVFAAFVKFVENNMETVLEIIQKRDEYSDERESVLCKGGAIMEKFWSSKGIDFWKEARIDERIDFRGFFSESSYDEEELKELFVRRFRKGVSAYEFLPKDTDIWRTNLQIHFDDEWLWIPTEDLYSIMKEAFDKRELVKVLLDLKEKKILKTDAEGLSKRTIIAGERREVYQIQRQFFNREGAIDVIALGGDGYVK